jgi:hypothetical protein
MKLGGLQLNVIVLAHGTLAPSLALPTSQTKYRMSVTRDRGGPIPDNKNHRTTLCAAILGALQGGGHHAFCPS